MKWLICLFRGHTWKFHDDPLDEEEERTDLLRTEYQNGNFVTGSVIVRFWSECERCKAKKDERVVSLDRYFKR